MTFRMTQARAVEPPRGRGTAAGCAWSAFLIVPIDATPFRCRQPLSSICQPGDGTLGHSCSASVEWPNPPREFPNIFTSRGSASSSQFDDAMIRRARMTIDRLKKRMDGRFTALERRVNGRFTELERRMNGRFTELERRMNGRFTKLERRTNRRFASVDARFDDVDARFAAVDARLDRMEARISARLDSVIEKLDTHFLINKNHFDHHTVILHEHDDRLKDLERQTGT